MTQFKRGDVVVRGKTPARMLNEMDVAIILQTESTLNSQHLQLRWMYREDSFWAIKSHIRPLHEDDELSDDLIVKLVAAKLRIDGI